MDSQTPDHPASTSVLPVFPEEPILEIIPADQLIGADGLPAQAAILTPPDWTVISIETDDLVELMPEPYRQRGIVSVDSASDLIAATNQRRRGPIALYAHRTNLTFTAVLNPATTDDNGWEDYMVRAQLQRTPEWLAWVKNQGLHSQLEFAEFIEDHLNDILEPAPAEMLELAQTFHAHTDVRFTSTQRLSSGSISVDYDEDTSVSAGVDRRIEIPSEFKIALRPFYGSDRVSVKVRLRYRVGRGELQLGWQLQRPNEIEEKLFDEEVRTAADVLEVEPVYGTYR